MKDPMVFVGKTWMGTWVQDPKFFPNGLEKITLAEASEQVAKHFNCTAKNARESLLRHGYASQPDRHWAVESDAIKGVMGYTERDPITKEYKFLGDRW